MNNSVSQIDYILIYDYDLTSHISNDQLDIYRLFSDHVLFFSEYFELKKDFGQSLNSFFEKHPSCTVLIASSEIEISQESIEELIRIKKLSEHHAFVTGISDSPQDSYGQNSCYRISYTILDLVVLIDTAIPFMISKLVENVPAVESINEWIKAASKCGFQLVEAMDSKYIKEENVKENLDCSLVEKKPRLLFFDNALTPAICGTSVHYMGLLQGILEVAEGKYEIDICTNKTAAEAHRISERFGLRTLSMNEVTDVYDLAFVPVQFFLIHFRFFADFLHKHALRWTIFVLDIISMRTEPTIVSNNMIFGYKKMIPFFDGFIHLSESSKRDFSVFFDIDLTSCPVPQRVVYLPAKICSEHSEYDLKVLKVPFDNYIMIMGNSMGHKMIKQTLAAIEHIDSNFIVIGAEQEGYINDRTYGYISGHLSEELINCLFANANLLIFPSVYEGFGLPVVDALNYGKDVVLVDRELNHELETLSPSFRGHLHYYSSFSELGKCIEEALSNTLKLNLNNYTRSWGDVGRDLDEFFDEIMDCPVDFERIKDRNTLFDLPVTDLPVSEEQERLRKTYFIKDSRYHTLVHIVTASYQWSDSVHIIDIYGSGINGRTLLRMIEKCCKVGCFVDRSPQLNPNISIPIVGIDDYSPVGEHILVVTPEYDFDSIRSYCVENCIIDEERIIAVSDFLEIKENADHE